MKKIIAIVMIFALTFTTLGATSAFAENQTYKLGDVDLDGEITVKDATLIQKFLADLEPRSSIPYYLANVYGTGVSVNSVTQIQKYVANIDLETITVGDEINLAEAPVFSSAVDLDAGFAEDSIIVVIKPEYGREYSLEDFPEFDFVAIHHLTELSQSAPMILSLKLKNPSTENVLAAIKALDYRAVTDLMYVEPNYILTST